MTQAQIAVKDFGLRKSKLLCGGIEQTVDSFSSMNRSSGQNRGVSRRSASFGKGLVQFWARANGSKPFTDTFTDSGRSDLCNSLLRMQQELEPVVGFEPTTDGLQNHIRQFATICQTCMTAA